MMRRMSTTPVDVPRAPTVRPIAGGDTWSVSEVVCAAGPGDRPYEERHRGFSVSAVFEGVFTYRSEHGASLLYPGAILFGNHHACYECGHRHSVGDRCVSFNLREDVFEEIAGTQLRRFLPADAAGVRQADAALRRDRRLALRRSAAARGRAGDRSR